MSRHPRPPSRLNAIRRVNLVLPMFILLAGHGLVGNVANSEEVRHRFIAADSSKVRIAMIDESGATAWEHKSGPLHDLQVLANDHVLFQTSWTKLIEVHLKNGDVVWEHDVTPGPGDAPIEVHAFQP